MSATPNMKMTTPRKKPPKENMGGGAGGGEKGQNIQVFVRSRPLNNAEKAQRSWSVLDTPNNREVVVKEKPNSHITKTFQFDRVFGAKSQQLEVYRAVVEPLIGQVTQGYNCTVFAYGQTGTGKTYTMEGGEGRDEPGMTWDKNPTSGIIPRAVCQLFDELRMIEDAEFSVGISFLELYNEELFDLLSPADDTNRLRLYEDSTRKGSVIIQGLEEVQVKGKMDVYSILERGSNKRQTAATLMNAHSSRSHTVFTVTVHIKESSVEGEELLKIGKLNLVDLAGSENIGRSGAKDKRAREAGNINQSLLTLGRVITCLVDRTPHIPYRESKLTRLLQDSLGGKTKTSIIATVGPASVNLEETLSTLEYASRAKNILNKPEVNQKLSKVAVLKEYTEEIERLRKDLMANREKNGVYIASENYQEMLSKIEFQSQEISEQIGNIKALKEEMEKKQELFEECEQELETRNKQLESTNVRLAETEHTLTCTKTVLQKTATERDEQKHLVEKHVETEAKLGQQARKLLVVSDETTHDVNMLHDKLDRKRTVEETNEKVCESFQENFEANADSILSVIQQYREQQEASCLVMKEQLAGQLEHRADQLSQLADTVTQLLDQQGDKLGQLQEMAGGAAAAEKEWSDELNSEVGTKCEDGADGAGTFLAAVKKLLEQQKLLMTEQSRVMAEMAVAVHANMDSHVGLVEKFSADILSSMVKVKKAVADHDAEQQVVMSDLKEKVEKIDSSEKMFGEILQQTMKKYVEHSGVVAANTAAIAISAGKAGERSGQLTNTVETEADRSSSVKTELSCQLTDGSAKIVNRIELDMEKCQQLNNELGEGEGKIWAKTDTFVADSQSAWGGLSADVADRVARRLSDSNDRREMVEEAVSVGRENLARGGEGVQAQVSFSGDQDRSGESRLQEGVAKMGALSAACVEDVVGGVGALRDGTGAFLGRELVQDVPTGLTPARTERPYPRYLAATSPHNRILDRLRKQTETIGGAGRLPLSDDDDDSVISCSSTKSLSRQDSGGDVAGEGDREVRRGSASSSRGGSKTSSRNGSVSDLISATSDYEEDGSVADRENQNPSGAAADQQMFVRPGKTTRRAIRKPEVYSGGRAPGGGARARNVLGSSSSNC